MPREVRKKSGIPLIAELAGVSIGTVDRALHGRAGINPRTLKRVLKVAQDIGYTPNVAARALSTGKHLRIGVCVPKELAYFYDEMWAGIREEAARYEPRGVEFVFAAVPELGKGEGSAFHKLRACKVDGILLTPGNPEIMAPLIDAAEKEGTRVVCVSTDAPMSRRSSVVCVEPRLNGLIAGELMAGFVPHGSKVAIVTGMLKTIDHREKAEGFTASFRDLSMGGAVVEVVEAHEHPTESFRKTRALLERVPDLAGIYVNTVNCLPVCRALAQADLVRKVRVIATDLFRKMIPAIESGAIAASIYQQPYVQGQLAVRALAEHLLHASQLNPTQYLNPSIILRANLNLFREATLISRPRANQRAVGGTPLRQ
jgi:LacI family transcriptional regulator, galactose operon repressor